MTYRNDTIKQCHEANKCSYLPLCQAQERCGLSPPVGPDLNSFIVACKRLIIEGCYTKDSDAFNEAFETLKTIVDQIPTPAQHEF